jgi:hypothetical protein
VIDHVGCSAAISGDDVQGHRQVACEAQGQSMRANQCHRGNQIGSRGSQLDQVMDQSTTDEVGSFDPMVFEEPAYTLMQLHSAPLLEMWPTKRSSSWIVAWPCPVRRLTDWPLSCEPQRLRGSIEATMFDARLYQRSIGMRCGSSAAAAC